MVRIFRGLHIVDNNSPGRVGGGGVPRRPSAPPICGAESPTRGARLKADDSAGGIILQSCQSGNASAVLVSGAGTEAVNGRYTACAGCGGLYRDVKFMKDPSHAMYLFEGTWRIAEPGVKVWYEAANGSQLGDGQPWVLKATADGGVAPPPSRVACEPCATTPCPRPPKPAHCPAPPPPPTNAECTGIMGFRSASGSPHGPWEGPTLMQGTTPSSSSWTGPDGIDNPAILGSNLLGP